MPVADAKLTVGGASLSSIVTGMLLVTAGAVILPAIGSSRFEATIEGLLCVADYELHQGVMSMTHTVVPSALEGRSIAAARSGEETVLFHLVRPTCSGRPSHS